MSTNMLRFPNVNSIVISGRLVRDVEFKYSQNNNPYTKNCIAVNHFGSKDEFGNFKEGETSFFDIVAFGKSAEKINECCKKGSPVLVEGSIKSRSFSDQNGVARKVTEIIVDRIHPLEKDENYQANQSYAQSQNSSSGYTNNQQTQTPQPQIPQPQQPVTNPAPMEPFPTESTVPGDLNTENDVPF